MRVNGTHYRSIQIAADGWAVDVVDQLLLPDTFSLARLERLEDAADAIRGMRVRGAPLIGATAAYGLALAMREDTSDVNLDRACGLLRETRPTAVNLQWAVRRMRDPLSELAAIERLSAAYRCALRICDDDVSSCRRIGEHGLEMIRALPRKRERINVLTHCNAGWLATVDLGTALAPVYLAHDAGLPIHVFVDETRPRNQGLLTAWELAAHGVPHTFIVDNAGGHLMQKGLIDVVIVGADRIAANGDVANKIGTYLKALAARANNVPFYVAAPLSTFDFDTATGRAIPIEERAASEVLTLRVGQRAMPLAVTEMPVMNPGFDVTPAELITGIITEEGLCAANAARVAQLERGE